MPDCQSIIDALLGGEIFSCIDLKAGFNNIPMDGPSIPLAAVVTQDGIFEPTRMWFGLKSAPAHFQRTITIILEGARIEIGPGGRIVVYIDDIALWSSSDDVEGLWARTVAAIAVLTRAGFMINIRKS